MSDAWQARIDAFLGGNQDAIYDLLIQATNCGPFDGACVLFAQALQIKYGGEIHVLLVAGADSNHTDKADHAFLKLNDIYVDGCGAGSYARLLRNFNEAGFGYRKITGHRAICSDDLPDSPRDTIVANRIADLLPETLPCLRNANQDIPSRTSHPIPRM